MTPAEVSTVVDIGAGNEPTATASLDDESAGDEALGGEDEADGSLTSPMVAGLTKFDLRCIHFSVVTGLVGTSSTISSMYFLNSDMMP